MRTEKGYRFTLQFPGTTEQQKYIGEYLEGLGLRKSSFVVEALSNYLALPPDKAKNAGFSKDDLKDAVREVLDERGVSIQLQTEPQPEESGKTGLDNMLDSMGAFG